LPSPRTQFLGWFPRAEPLEVVLYPDPRLAKATKPVPSVDDSVRQMAGRMIATMHRAGGIGIAATQVGWDRRVCIVSGTGDPGDEIVLVNPRIVRQEGTALMEEGCLSFPGIAASITRAAEVTVEFTDLDGKPVSMAASNLLGRCILHEVDHLDGVLFTTRFTPADRVRLKRALRDLQERFDGEAPGRRTAGAAR
jgi:peptide deformylase